MLHVSVYNCWIIRNVLHGHIISENSRAVNWKNVPHRQSTGVVGGAKKTLEWKKNKKNQQKNKESGVPEADLHGRPLPTCRRHYSSIFAFSPPLGAGIQVYPPAGTGRTPLRLLRIVCRRAPGSFSCMLDILLNTSFLDDMGDHSKSKSAYFFLKKISKRG